jgi:hypothetical protein
MSKTHVNSYLFEITAAKVIFDCLWLRCHCRSQGAANREVNFDRLSAPGVTGGLCRSVVNRAARRSQAQNRSTRNSTGRILVVTALTCHTVRIRQPTVHLAVGCPDRQKENEPLLLDSTIFDTSPAEKVGKRSTFSSLRGASTEVLSGDLRNFFHAMCSTTDYLAIGASGL